MPTREQLRRALTAIKRRADYEYFFEQLSSPDWIEPLLEERIFASPDPPEQENGYIRFPFWPPSRYLARVSAQAPERVLNVILSIPETDNVRVHEDFVDAALSMPPRLAAQIVDKALNWLDSPHQLLMPHKLGELLAHLARGNESAAALKLARALLRLRGPDTQEDQTQFANREATAYFQEYEYEEILKGSASVLVDAAGKEAVELLADLLAEANRIASSNEHLPSGTEPVLDDHSNVWRPAIEEHEQNHPYHLRHYLVPAIRDALEGLAARDESIVASLVETLESRRWIIFYRLALHLLRRFPDSAPGALAERVADEWRFNDSRVRHEYGLLLRSSFPSLPEEVRTQVLSRIEAGPGLDRLRSRAKEADRDLTEDEIRRYVTWWKLERLGLIGKDQLPGMWTERYERWASELGEPEHPEFPVYSTGMWHGPTSPKSAADLRSMSVEEIISVLSAWEPQHAWMSPSREGLGRALQEVVATEPTRFADASDGFRNVRPVYVRAVLSGLRDSSKEKTFEWRPVLTLIGWLIQQRDDDFEVPPPGTERDEDPDWSWSRKAAADLVEKGLETGPSEIPFELRPQVWGVLERLTRDSDPTPESEARYGGTSMDPATMALNTVRGVSMHAVMRYAMWVRRHIDTGRQGSGGFDEMPEVRAALDEHLDTATDPSLTVRSVYGRWLPWLVSLDRDWTTSRLAMIFPRNEEQADFWCVAWDTYVTFSAVYDDVFEVLRDEYRVAVDRMQMPRSTREHADPDQKLAEHIVVLYWRGLLSLSDEIFRRFFATAKRDVRTHAMRFVGVSLQNTKDEVPLDIRKRLEAFWSSRVEQIGGSKDLAERGELAEFGWWYASGKMDDNWALNQVMVAVERAGRVEPEHLILKRLASLAGRAPQTAVRVLRDMVRHAREPWRVLGWNDEMRTLLAGALGSGDERGAEMAEDLINELGARNVRDFGDLLRQRRR